MRHINYVLFATLTLSVSALASECPNLAGHYHFVGDDHVTHRITIEQISCARVNISHQTGDQITHAAFLPDGVRRDLPDGSGDQTTYYYGTNEIDDFVYSQSTANIIETIYVLSPATNDRPEKLIESWSSGTANWAKYYSRD
jgi:hypothetical protein